MLTHYMSRGYEVRELLRRELSSDYLLVRDPEAFTAIVNQAKAALAA